MFRANVLILGLVCWEDQGNKYNELLLYMRLHVGYSRLIMFRLYKWVFIVIVIVRFYKRVHWYNVSQSKIVIIRFYKWFQWYNILWCDLSSVWRSWPVEEWCHKWGKPSRRPWPRWYSWPLSTPSPAPTASVSCVLYPTPGTGSETETEAVCV